MHRLTRGGGHKLPDEIVAFQQPETHIALKERGSRFGNGCHDSRQVQSPRQSLGDLHQGRKLLLPDLPLLVKTRVHDSRGGLSGQRNRCARGIQHYHWRAGGNLS